MQERKINDVLKIGREILDKSNIDAREARLLLAEALNVSAIDLIKLTSCSDDDFAKYLVMLEKRVNDVPFAYIVGHKEFMKLDFIVNENVLIPRGDTEILVEEALKYNKNKILDMCTGSGCIAVSLAHYQKNNVKVTAVDISEEALNVAKQNAKKNNVDVNFIQSDLFSSVNEKYEMIVSNPPYIEREVIENLQLEVQKEPMIALDGGISGLDFYEKIIPGAKEHLEENGVLLLEIGYNQAESVQKLMQESGYKNIKLIKDLGGNDRVVIGEI
ncbi:MAG: peptide chain release factor N(5)-glutamine methyltransferase [Clostridia bacterium]|nr:peptide chain release factor N(5)-glutamine methyltransferase [Clostridia bacterium]